MPASPLDSKAAKTRPSLISFPAFFAWAAAACLALATMWLGQRYVAVRGEATRLREETALARLAIKSEQNRNEAAQILARHQLDALSQQVATTAQQLAASQQRAAGAESRLADAALQLATAARNATDAAAQVAQLNQRLASADRLAADTRAHSAELDRALASAQTQVAALQRDLRAQGDLANFKITPLASMLKNSPQAAAVAVWNPAKQEGMLKVEKLPALAADKSYQLWVVDPQYPAPVDGGVFTVDAQTGEARVQFTGKQPIAAVNAFTVTLERKGGVPKAEGPFVLMGK